MTMTMATTRRTRRRPQLDHIALGSNPKAESRWSQRTGRTADITKVDFFWDGSWSVSCNVDRVGLGTIGWIASQGAGGNPPLCGIIVCTAEPQPSEEVDVDGNVVEEYYVDGRLYGGLWVPGADIAAAGWPDAIAPWGSTARRQFQNGQTITPEQLDALLDVVPDRTLRATALEYNDVTGHMPTWA